jgi:hypothetical protein
VNTRDPMTAAPPFLLAKWPTLDLDLHYRVSRVKEGRIDGP